MIHLRDYQDRLVSGARERLRAGVRRPLIVAPTGAGKTVMAAFMQGGAAERGQRTWFTVQPFVAREGSVPAHWQVRIRMPGVTDEQARKVGPPFDLLEDADQYRAWCAREVPTFAYPEGRA